MRPGEDGRGVSAGSRASYGLLVVLLLSIACAAPRQAARRETVLAHPLSAHRERQATAVFGDLSGPGKKDPTSDRERSSFQKDRGAVSGLPVLAATGPTGDLIGGLLLAAAHRLVGIRGSFDQRSFLGHLLRIHDLLPPKASAIDWRAGESLKMARKAGTLRPIERAEPGDLLFFACPGQCGPMGEDGIAACVVAEADTDGGRCIGYWEGEVRFLRFGRRSSSEPQLGKVEGVSAPLEPPGLAGPSPSREGSPPSPER